jgi:cation transport protein ChaC
VNRPETAPATQDLWVFAYGSLIWNPDVPCCERRVGHVEGWSRRFYQGSIDHRGEPGQPGRVATLTREQHARCSGVAFRVPAAFHRAALERLDDRELVRGGYRRERAVFTPRAAGPAIDVLLYAAAEDNPLYLGPADDDAIADDVRAARGRCGSNADYLTTLCNSLRALRLRCEHTFAVERALLAA